MNDVPQSSIGWGKPMAWGLNVYGSLGGRGGLALTGDVR
jgi:hypothetical protein